MAGKEKTPTGRFPGRGFGGLEGIRTLGLRVANAALSQLSYEPGKSNPELLYRNLFLLSR